MKTYTIIGGVNGVGKSSFTGVLKERCEDLGQIIDVDKINNPNDNIKTDFGDFAKEDKYVEEKKIKSFNVDFSEVNNEIIKKEIEEVIKEEKEIIKEDPIQQFDFFGLNNVEEAKSTIDTLESSYNEKEEKNIFEENLSDFYDDSREVKEVNKPVIGEIINKDNLFNNIISCTVNN